MGIYHGEYENPCPRCGTGRVNTTFISVSPMSFYAACSACGANDFTKDERKSLGENRSGEEEGE